MQIIGIMGPAGAGKSTIALKLIEAHGFVRMSMADPLKAGLRAMGIPLELETNRALRDVPSPLLCGRSWRFVAQTMGTEWGRNTIGADLWVNLLRERLKDLPPTAKVVIDDIRFPNEIALIRELGGSIWKVTRPGLGEPPALWRQILEAFSFGLFPAEHPSETLWRSVVADVDLGNDTTPEALHALTGWALAT